MKQKQIYDDPCCWEANNTWVSRHKCSDKKMKAGGMRASRTYAWNDDEISQHEIKPGKRFGLSELLLNIV